MLDAKSLEVLQSLKSEIKANKVILNGHIKGTGKNFGFVVCDDGNEYFLPPDEMAKVFPGDKVTFTVVEQDDGKSKAELETLEASEFSEFKGVFYVRGKAQGVEPFNDAFNGWLFVPPKSTCDAAHNDIVHAKVTRHPWKTGKAQAEVVKTLGSADNNRSWYSMTLAEQGIPETFSDAELNEVDAAVARMREQTAQYADRTSTPFVTIDAATTKDMDDALYATKTDDGWMLSVAIADASAFINPGSLLDQAARLRLTTTYLPGLTLPMLPEALADDAMSLVANEIRPALIFDLAISTDGAVTGCDISLANIQNHGKLDYLKVSEWFAEGTLPSEFADTLTTLKSATDALANWRKTHANQMQDRIDYRIRVDENFDVTTIDAESRNLARDLVEEAMIATNAQAAKFLMDDAALFMAHDGFKPDRESELKGLLRDYAPAAADLDGHSLPDFIKILKEAATVENFPLSNVLIKRFDRGYWSNRVAPHFGLGLPQYTNATSPIRKYSDLLIHRAIKSKLVGDTPVIETEVIDDFNARGNQSRQVAQTIENRLRLKWLAALPKQSWKATIVHINANGLIAQITENGATGFVDLRKKKDEYSYDPLRMMLKFEDFNYLLTQEITVQISKIDNDNLVLALV